MIHRMVEEAAPYMCKTRKYETEDMEHLDVMSAILYKDQKFIFLLKNQEHVSVPDFLLEIDSDCLK